MHRIIMGAEVGEEVDHKDGNGLNNSRANLRICQDGRNQWNQRKVASGLSKFKGVSWHKQWKYWTATIQVNKNFMLLVRTRDEIAAARIYDAAARKFFGEYANTNFSLVNDNLEDLIAKFRIPKKKSSQFPGVYGIRKGQRWKAMYFRGKAHIYIGSFKSEQEAATAFANFIRNKSSQDSTPVVNEPMTVICP